MADKTAAIASGVVIAVGAAAAITGTALYFVFKNRKPKGSLKDPDQAVPVRIVDRQVYKPNEKFPNGGKMSQHLEAISKNHYVDIFGPFGDLVYLGNGDYKLSKGSRQPPVKGKVKEFGMICGGSGITPMYQLLKYILESKEDMTKISLLYANNSEDDILLRDELDDISQKYPNQFRCWYTITQAPDNWKYSTGYIDEDMISKNISPPSVDQLVLLCGPPPMLDLACMPNLTKLNYPRDQIYIF